MFRSTTRRIGVMGLVLALVWLFARGDGDLQEKEDDARQGGAPGLFVHEDGEYKTPHLVIEGGEPKEDPPEELPCFESFVIYSSRAKTVEGCEGYGGEDDLGNDVCLEAAGYAKAAVKEIGCPKDCPDKSSKQIWASWECNEKTPGVLRAVCAVEVEMICLGGP